MLRLLFSKCAMRIKITIFILILFTIALIQNDGKVELAFLWLNYSLSKKALIAIIAIFAFIAGCLAAGKKNNTDTNTLSQQDRDYIN